MQFPFLQVSPSSTCNVCTSTGKLKQNFPNACLCRSSFGPGGTYVGMLKLFFYHVAFTARNPVTRHTRTVFEDTASTVRFSKCSRKETK